MSDSLDPMTAARQASRPSSTPGVHPNPCPLSRWCHPAISSSVVPSPPDLSLSQHQDLFQWAGSSHQVAKVLKLQHQSFQWIQDWLRLTDLMSLLSKGVSSVFSSTTVWKASILPHLAFSVVQLSHLYMTTGKIIALPIWTSDGKVMSLLVIHCLHLL